MSSVRSAKAVLFGLAMVSCTGSSRDDDGDAPDPGDEMCVATLSVMQKDAYRATGGSPHSLWPPHTTTQLDVMCGGLRVAGGLHVNHGPTPDEVDQNDTPVLTRVASLAAEGKRSELEALASAYQTCECATSAVSLNRLEDESVEELLVGVGDYIADNLACSGGIDEMGLSILLRNGELDTVIAELPNCSWAAGASWSAAFDSALSAIIAPTETLADRHVSNNDALLQGQLLQTFAVSGDVFACDGLGALCHGPLWYYQQ